MTDIKIIQTDNGGELVQTANDLAVVSGVENTPYLAMFGGSEWVGNFLTDKPYECRTERVLNEVTLNSAGRLAILEAVNTDLAYLSDIPGTVWSADVIITGPYSVKITVDMNGEVLDYYWNPQQETEVPAVPAGLCPLITGLTATPDGAAAITVEWDAATTAGYQYAYNDTGDAPAAEDWVSTTAITVSITGLTASTLYYVFVRNVCAVGFYSAYESATATTSAVEPVLPLLIDPILSVWSTTHVLTTGANVTAWEDLSPEANHLTAIATNPTKENGVFGSYPGILFQETGGGSPLKTTGLFSGLSGLPSSTWFIVMKAPEPAITGRMLQYSASAGAPVPGEFEAYHQKPGVIPEVNTNMRGNVGFCNGQMRTEGDTAIVLTIDMDFAKAAAAELRMYKNNSDADYTAGISSNNTGTFTAAPLTIGNFTGHIGAIVAYPGSLSGSDRAAVDSYLRTYFSIP